MTTTEEAPPEDSSLGVHRERRRQWWHRHLDSGERQRVMAELAIKRQHHWAYRFTVMTTLSVIVAVMGLSADSAAVVIGAMLLAPLMQPVLGIAACIAMALFRKSLRSFGIVALATLWSIVLSYVLGGTVRQRRTPERGDEPDGSGHPRPRGRARPRGRRAPTRPCGGTSRRRCPASRSLSRWCRRWRRSASRWRPGTDVRLGSDPALHHEPVRDRARRCDRVRGHRLRAASSPGDDVRRSSLVAAVVGVVVVAIALPLYGASTSAVERSEREVEALELVSLWLGPTDRRSAPQVSFDDQRITVAVRSFDPPPDPEPLIAGLQAAFGVDRIVSIEWIASIRRPRRRPYRRLPPSSATRSVS